MRTHTVLITFLISAVSFAQSQTVVLQDGTPIKLRLGRNLSSAEAQVGETVDFEVLEEIAISGVSVVAKGATAIGTITEAQRKRRMGRAGKLNVVVDHVRLANGDRAALRAVKDSAGGSNVGKMTGAIVATSIVFFPAAPLFLLAHGKDIKIPKGTEITAYVNGDMKIDPVKATSSIPSDVRSPSESKDSVLVNGDVLKLKAAGFSDEMILSTIQGQQRVNFELDADSLIELKSSGISERIIAAMLQKAAN